MKTRLVVAIAIGAALLSSCFFPWTHTNTVSAPQFLVGSGSYSSPLYVGIYSTTPGASIIYTTDGSDPSMTHGNEYYGPIVLTSSATVKAFAYLYGMEDSAISSSSYTVGSGSFQGSISGTVKDIVPSGGAFTNTALAGVTVQLSNATGAIAQTLTGSDGSYTFDTLAAGENYELDFALSGYEGTHYYGLKVTEGSTSYAQTAILIANAYTKTTGVSSGTLTNAFTGAAISGVTISLSSGINAQANSPIVQATSDTTGFYSFSALAAGVYTASISLEGFISVNFTLLSVGSQTMGSQNASISPSLSATGLRAVLTWGSSPDDLDAHMTTPSATYGHVYYANKGSDSIDPFTKLDVDDTDKYGPETVTISQVLNGTYTFYVHDYTNRSLSTSSALKDSGAVVKVYQGNSLLCTFNVPQMDGTLWKVFSFDGTNITPDNSMLYEGDSATVPSRRPGTNVEASLFGNLPSK